MKKCFSILLSLMLTAMFCFGGTASTFAEAGTGNGGFEESLAGEDAPRAEGQLIVTYDGSTSDRTIRNDIGDVGSVADITRVEDTKVVLTDLDKNEERAARILDRNDKAIDVQPNYRYSLTSEGTADPYLDPENTLGYQYYMGSTNAEAAWTFVEENKTQTTIVGVVDTGVDSRHEDLTENLLTLDEKKTYKGFHEGEAVDLNDDTADHGTHVTGIIGADYNNGKGGAGVASGHNNDLVDVITTSASSAGESLYTYDICAAIDYNVAQGARVISMSFGGSGEDTFLERCIRQHYEEDGTVFVAASGNDGSDAYSTPCDYPTVIAVNASDRNGNATYFSDYGELKDISAPGANVMSTIPGDLYDAFSGTSMATPVVAGICGLMLDVSPSLTPAQVKSILCSTTREAQKEGIFFKQDLASGNVDALQAVEAAKNASSDVAAEDLKIKENYISGAVVLSSGQSRTLSALLQPAECLQDITWSSSDESVAAVDQYGKVTAVSEGTAVITASCGEASDELSILVKKAGDGTEPETAAIKDKEKWEADGIELNDTDVVDIFGEGAVEEGYFDVELQPETASVEYEFASSDNSVLFVDATGSYVPKKPGTVTVTLWKAGSRQDAGKLDEMTVDVRAAVKKIIYTKKTNQLDIGSSFDFDAEPAQENAYHPDITWSASNSKGSIDPETGLFKALKTGSCYVVAKTENGVYRSCKVTITKKKYAGADYKLKAKKVSKGKKVSLSWKTIPCATVYQIQKKVGNGKWTTAANVRSCKYTDKKFGKKSSYRVRAKYNKSGKTGWNGWSSTVTVKK